MLPAGQLNRRITIQKPADSQDSLGQPVVQWQDYARVWARLRPVSPSTTEAVRSGQDSSLRRINIRIRYRADIDPSMRVVDPNGSAYGILAGSPAEDSREFVDLLVSVTT